MATGLLMDVWERWPRMKEFGEAEVAWGLQRLGPGRRIQKKEIGKDMLCSLEFCLEPWQKLKWQWIFLSPKNSSAFMEIRWKLAEFSFPNSNPHPQVSSAWASKGPSRLFCFQSLVGTLESRAREKGAKSMRGGRASPFLVLLVVCLLWSFHMYGPSAISPFTHPSIYPSV